MQRRQRCCAAVPWVPLACLVILAVGIPIWVLHSYAAAASTRDALSAATVDAATLQAVLSMLNTSRVAVLAVAIVAAVLALVLAAGHACSRAGAGPRPPALRGLLAADALNTVVLWALLVGAAVLLAITASWLVCSIAADLLLNTATQYSNTAEKAANRAVGSAQALIEQLKGAQLSALDAAPQEIKDTEFFKQFRNGVSTFNQTVANAAGTPAGSACQPGCISLDFLAGLAGLNSSCICLTQTISSVQQGLQATKQATLRSLVGLALVFLSTSWLLAHAASTYTSTRRDLQEYRRRTKTSSAGEGGMGGMGGLGVGHASTHKGHRLPHSSDALIDVLATSGSAASGHYKGGQGAAGAAAAGGANGGQHYRDTVGYPVVQSVAVDTRGPRDVSRLPRV